MQCSVQARCASAVQCGARTRRAPAPPGAAPRRTANCCRRQRPRNELVGRRAAETAAAAAGGGAGPTADDDAGGEVYQVTESGDDVWAHIQLPVAMTSPEGQQVEYLVLDTDGALAEPAVEAHLARLQQERTVEADADAAAAAAAAQGADGRADGGDRWVLDPTLLRRMAAVRDAERGTIVQELMYLLCIQRLKLAGVTIVTDLGDAAPSGPSAAAVAAALAAAAEAPEAAGGSVPGASATQPTGRDTMGRRMEQLMPLVSLPVADSILGYVGATVTNSMRLLARDTPLSIDRVQGARLYGGMLEFGYFSRALEEVCEARGVPLGNDSEAMVRVADTLPEDELQALCEVQTADGWYTAVRHTGGLFRLRPNPELSFDSTALPYADLAHTVSDIVLQPAAAIAEHYSPPGAAEEAARAAARKAARGWGPKRGAGGEGGDDSGADGGMLPPADLVAFKAGEFGALLVEAAVVGCLLRDAELRVSRDWGYALAPKAKRRRDLAGGDSGSGASDSRGSGNGDGQSANGDSGLSGGDGSN